MSVTVKANWIDCLRNEKSIEEFLTEMAEQQRCHRVEVIPDGERWRLDGCICGIKAAREEFIRRKKHLEAVSHPSIQSSNVQGVSESGAATHLIKDENIRRERKEDEKTEDDKVTTNSASLSPCTLSGVQQIQMATTQLQKNKLDHSSCEYKSISSRHSITSNDSAEFIRGISEEDRDRNFALKFVRNVKVDRPVFNFLRRKEIDEMKRISGRCTLFESYEDGRSHRLAIQAKPGEDIEAIVTDFEGLCLQVTEQVIPLPDEALVGDFEEKVKAKLDMKKVDLYFAKDANICQMFGRKKEIAELRRKLEDLFHANKAERSQPNRAPHVSHGGSGYYPPHSPAPGSNYVSSAPYKPSLFTICRDYQHHLQVQFNGKDQISLELIGGDMFEVCNYSDAAVTLIDHNLNPLGILANRIASNYYPGILNELHQLKFGLPFLHTGALVSTNTWGFPAAKVLLHVVPPTTFEFSLTDQRSKNALRSSFVNCIKYTNDVLKMNSLCLPAIGCSK